MKFVEVIIFGINVPCNRRKNNLYSNTYNPSWMNHPNFGRGGNLGKSLTLNLKPQLQGPPWFEANAKSRILYITCGEEIIYRRNIHAVHTNPTTTIIKLASFYKKFGKSTRIVGQCTKQPSTWKASNDTQVSRMEEGKESRVVELRSGKELSPTKSLKQKVRSKLEANTWQRRMKMDG